MKTQIVTLFTRHPKSVGESYWQHLLFASGFAVSLALACGAALVHAVFPFACEKTASRIVAQLYKRTCGRGD